MCICIVCDICACVCVSECGCVYKCGVHMFVSVWCTCVSMCIVCMIYVCDVMCMNEYVHCVWWYIYVVYICVSIYVMC